MSSSVIRVRGLTRTFSLGSGPVHAVRGIDLTVGRGEILGFLGPNGAGKTTTLRMLTTLLPPSGGEAEIAGHDLLRDPAGVRRRIGYVAQSGGLDPACSVREELVTQGRLHLMSKGAAAGRAADLGLSGLDLVRRVRAEHATTVFLTTHCLDEADALADRIVVVDAGRIVAEGTSAELKRRHAGDPAAGLQDAFLAITGRATAGQPLAI